MEIVTIITPTYNRKVELEKLFHSLCDQRSENFRWLVVDDGSEDGTEKYIEDIKKSAKFKIDYIKKENGGKHTALNLGVQSINTELTIIVDSDDVLLPNAVEEISEIYEKYKNYQEIASFTFLRMKSDGKIVVPLEKKEFVANYIQYRIKGNRPGDMAEVYRTAVLKEYPFPEFENEKFLSEDVCWIEIGKKYNSVYIDKAIYQCEYLNGGLTYNDKPLKFKSPNGSMMRGRQLMSSECGIKVNIKGAIIYNCYSMETDSNKVPLLSSYQKLLVYLTKPVGVYFNKKWKCMNKEKVQG